MKTKFKNKQKGISILSSMVVIVIALVLIKTVFSLGQGLLVNSKSSNLVTQILQLKMKIIDDGTNYFNYTHLNVGNDSKNQSYLVDRALVPSDWSYDSVGGWFVTRNNELVRILNNTGNVEPSGDVSYSYNSGFRILIRVKSDNMLELYRALKSGFYAASIVIEGFRFNLKKGDGDGGTTGNFLAALASAADEPNIILELELVSL
ncbi:MAG: hypothetical protein QM504_03310 [Pseudomonadota bacterium]